MIACASAMFFSLSGPYPVRDATISGGNPHSPTGFGRLAPSQQPQPCHQDGIECFAVDCERHRLANFGIVERRIDAIDHQVDLRSRGYHLADRFRRAAFTSLIKGTLTSDGKVISKSPVAKASIRVA